MKKVICSVIIILLLAGCRTKTPAKINGNAEIIEIPEKVTESIVDVVDNYQYIILDAGENVDAALGGIAKLRVFRGKIYVMDNVMSNNFLIYDTNGVFLKKISQVGRGPQEYIDMSTFEIDGFREEILLKENAGNKILVFDLDGNYKRTLNNPLRAGGMAVLPNGNIVYGVEGYRTNGLEAVANYKLIICDQENEVLKKYCEDKAQYPYGFSSLNFMNPGYDSTVTFAPQFMNDIFRISEQGVDHIYRINFTDMLDRNELCKYDAMGFERSHLVQKTIFLGNHADSKDWFHFRYKHNNQDYFAYFDKKQRSTIISNDKMCAKNLTFDDRGNVWGSIMEADLLHAKHEKALEIKEAIVKSENPIVVCYTMK